jgi:transcriptional regulator with XRE-family HTH domain
MSHIGTNIRSLRSSRNISQEALAQALKVRQSTISMIEIGNNEPSMKMLRKLAEFFDVAPAYFLSEHPTLTVHTPTPEVAPQL